MRKALILISCVAVLVVLVLACCPPSSGNLSKPAEQGKERTKTVKVNENLQVGEVRWKVTEVEKKDQIERGEYIAPLAAQGSFVILALEVELLGKESGNISSAQFVIVDSKGREFKADDEASSALTMAGNEQMFFSEVHPNVVKNGKVAFDIAKDATGLKLKIKDLRMFSDEFGYVDLGI